MLNIRKIIMIYDEKTGLAVGDPKEVIFPDVNPIPKEEKEEFLKNSIFSVSGWRRVFAADGDEQSSNPEINTLEKVMVGGAARLFAKFACKIYKGRQPTIVIGLDSRYTGPKIGLVMIRALLAYGCDVRYIFIASAPEIMAYTKTLRYIDGFMYVSASHNPIGHNGLKFGLDDGAVLGQKDAQPLIDEFKKSFLDDTWVATLMSDINSVPSAVIESIFNEISNYKNGALKKYTAFTNHVITGIENPALEQEMMYKIRKKIAAKKIGVVAEMNGSARGVSIDVDYLTSFGLEVTALNDKPREFVHRIVPEGKSLNLACEELQKIAVQYKNYKLAYVPDCDGDRGNIVTLDDKGESYILQAQEVFALSVLSELSYLVYSGILQYDEKGKLVDKAAVVVNGPTSGRIEQIASAFGVEVFRAEVGEANVVSLAMFKKKEGYIVRILGEGSNGGNITLPSTVRDPINTIFAFVKMLVLASEDGKPGLFEIWCDKSGQNDKYKDSFELIDVVKSMPMYVTTSAFENRAIVSIQTDDHAVLKANYEKVLVEQLAERKKELNEKLGITSYRLVNYEGSITREGIGSRTGEQRGGFKVLFSDNKGKEIGYIWMRGSGTEPVFRVLADVKGTDESLEKYLLDWHVSMIKKSDSM